MNKTIYEFWKEKGIDDSVLLPIMDRLEERNKIILDLDKKYNPTGCSCVSCTRKIAVSEKGGKEMDMMSLFAEMITAQTSNKYSATVQEPNGNYVWIDTRYTADHGWETMVFKCDDKGNVSDWGDLDCNRYDNEEEARVGHQQMVSKWGIDKANEDKGTYIYEVVHYYDTDGGFGDAIPQEDVIAVFSTEEKADEFVEKYANPHVYDQPYADLRCGVLRVRGRKINVMPDESDMWWREED